jgi:hypothetical protein
MATRNRAVVAHRVAFDRSAFMQRGAMLAIVVGAEIHPASSP